MSILDAFRLEDQVAVVTGAGIGRAVAELFSKAGAKVVVSDLKAEAAQEVANIIQKSIGAAVPVACNVTEDAARTHLVQQAMDAFGKITILVNNAGGGGPKPFGMPMETFIWAFKLNVFSVFHLYQL